VALIELSRDQPLVAATPLPPAYRYRALGLALTVILVLALAGAVPAQAYFWRHAGLVSLPFEADFQLAGGRMFTFEVAGGRRITSAWAVHPLRRVWRVVSTAEDTSGGLVQGGASVSMAGKFVLVQAGQTSTVLDARTGSVRWRSPLPVVPVSETVGMVEEEHFKAGTEYDEASGDAGALFFGSDGRPHTEPPLRTELTGVELATGRPVWAASFAGSIYPVKARGISDSVVVAAAGQLSLRSAADGEVLATEPLPAAADGGSTSARVVGDLLLIGQAEVVTAYTMADLDRRWQLTQPADPRNVASCTGVVCAKSGPALAVLDPATGTPLWQTDDDVDVLMGADYDIQLRQGESRPVRAVAPESGSLAVDLSDWQTFAPTSGAGLAVLTRPDPGRGTAFGVLRPGSRLVEQLGVTRAQVTGCAADVRFVACRVPAGVEVFTYAA
jgi:outer membrane protein assembly factor BamB